MASKRHARRARPPITLNTLHNYYDYEAHVSRIQTRTHIGTETHPHQHEPSTQHIGPDGMEAQPALAQATGDIFIVSTAHSNIFMCMRSRIIGVDHHRSDTRILNILRRWMDSVCLRVCVHI